MAEPITSAIGATGPDGRPGRVPTRWVTETAPGHSQRYADRFRQLAEQGADLAGEARFLDATIGRASLVLDAGCGTGRVAVDLAARGHQVTGVDADPVLIGSARTYHPDLTWVLGDLTDVDVQPAGADAFDAVILAGNVMVYLAPGTEREVLRHLGTLVRPDGIVVAGFATDRTYQVSELDRDAAAVGLAVEHRFATWDLGPTTVARRGRFRGDRPPPPPTSRRDRCLSDETGRFPSGLVTPVAIMTRPVRTVPGGNRPTDTPLCTDAGGAR